MKTLIGLLFLGLSFNVFALRCSSEIIQEGMALHEVQSLCKGGHVYQVHNQQADIVRYYYEDSGMTYEMVFIDGRLYEINSNR